MTSPNPEAVRAVRRAALVRSLTALFFVICGVTAATVGAGITWGTGPALLLLGVSLFIVGLFIAYAG